jgi:hypothetical protein
MIAVKEFIAILTCDECESEKEHLVEFESYDPINHKVFFIATCLDCEKKDGVDVMHTRYEISTAEWNKYVSEVHKLQPS